MPQESKQVSFLVFFLIWARVQRWAVPALHVQICDWLEHRGDAAVLNVFRGAAKSTILAIYNAWRYYQDPSYRILHQGDQDGTAYKTSRDTKSVLRRHPLTQHLRVRGESAFWWVEGSQDERNPSMQATGIMSNITSSRADEVQNDDVEVPRNIRTAQAREQLRYRLTEQTHILVPGGRTLFVGTPHTHESIYDEEAKGGADVLKLPLFSRECRLESVLPGASVDVEFEPEIMFCGIHKYARLLEQGRDYRVAKAGKQWRVTFKQVPAGIVDVYAGCAWPERFTREEMAKRRRKCRTINEWDSQYQLHAKPVGQVRLDPQRLIPYDCEPLLRTANERLGMHLGGAQIVAMTARWDPASGKTKSDVSAFALTLFDAMGRKYLHRCEALTGEVAVFGRDAQTITGGQVWQIAALVREFSIPRIEVETNGIGQFAPSILRACLRQQRLHCGVAEVVARANKNKRILEAIEPPLSAGVVWAHVSVASGPLWEQMRDWNPAVQDQDDDHLDAVAGTLEAAPERIGKIVGKTTARQGEDWRPEAGVHELEFER